MMTILAVIGVIIAILVIGLLVYAATMPKEFRIVRSITISAPAETVYPLINDLKTMNDWNPFAKEPGMNIVYTGPAGGKGAGFHWDSKGGRGGKGSMETLDASSPTNVTLRLDMEKPMEGHNTVIFTLRPAGSATDVSWTMFGPYPYLNRIFGAILNTDKMIGGAFDKGLADLKALAEQ